MSPIVHLVRHAQGYHNLSPESQVLRDPTLTPTGLSQCQILSSTFPRHDKIELIVSSPMKRTLYTALNAFAPALKANPSVKIIALPQLQETSSIPCDTGSSKADIEKEFMNYPIDFSLVDEDWNSKVGQWGTTGETLAKRAMVARQWLKNREEKEIVVVTHGGFLHNLTQDWTNSKPFESNVPSVRAEPGSTKTEHLTGSGWDKCELRTFAFVGEEGDNASMKETEESVQKRMGRKEASLGKPRLEVVEIKVKA